MLTTSYRASWKDLTRDEVKRRIKIQQLNDRLRKTLPRTQDMILILGDLRNEDYPIQMRAYQLARAFDAFTEENDPHGEHDCASFQMHNERVMFKIDYLDQNLKFHSPDPADPDITRRVMSLFYARDY
jgi:hypothetical protein